MPYKLRDDAPDDLVTEEQPAPTPEPDQIDPLSAEIQKIIRRLRSQGHSSAHICERSFDIEDEAQAILDRRREEDNLTRAIAEMDETSLVLSLVAANPALEDILPEDSHLLRDVADIRRKIAERQLQFGEHTSEIKHIVNRHVHLHLWDEHTHDRIKALGASVAGLFRMAKDKIIDAKVQLIDNDDREVIGFGEAARDFKETIKSMAGFLRGHVAPAPLQEATDEVLEPIPEEDRIAAVRLASAAAGDALDADLKEVGPAEGVRYYSEIQVFPMIEDGEGNARLINSADTFGEKADFYDVAFHVRDAETHDHIEDHPLYREWDNLTLAEASEVANALRVVHPDVDFDWLQEPEPHLQLVATQTATPAQKPDKPKKKPFKLMGDDGPDM